MRRRGRDVTHAESHIDEEEEVEDEEVPVSLPFAVVSAMRLLVLHVDEEGAASAEEEEEEEEEV
jgi:hypothetical protein